MQTDVSDATHRKVIDNVEEFADLLGRLALDHVGDRLAADVTVPKTRLALDCVGCHQAETHRSGLMSR